VIAGLCPPDEVQAYRAEQHLVEEIQVATRVGPGIARRDIETARLLAGPFARSRADLALGLISEAHVRVLVFATSTVVDDPDTVPAGQRVTREEKLLAVQLRVAAATQADRVRVLEGHLVIDLATLRREADYLCLLDGTPIPAPVGRELARSVRAWRRVVTDPVTGHLLDYGRRVYLPPPLLRFIHARDGQCTAPYCQRPATRCQNDHRVPFPEGPSNTANCGLLCDRHHPLKTDRYVSITDGHADGSMTWNTAWGQQIHTEPRPYLDSPNPPRTAAADHDDTGPPGAPDQSDDDSQGPLPF
jgi:hypothetical protein